MKNRPKAWEGYQNVTFGGSTIDEQSMKIRSKIDPESNQKQDAILNGFWKALGPVLVDFEAKLKAKLGPRWHQNRKKWGTVTTLTQNTPCPRQRLWCSVGFVVFRYNLAST